MKEKNVNINAIFKEKPGNIRPISSKKKKKEEKKRTQWRRSDISKVFRNFRRYSWIKKLTRTHSKQCRTWIRVDFEGVYTRFRRASIVKGIEFCPTFDIPNTATVMQGEKKKWMNGVIRPRVIA